MSEERKKIGELASTLKEFNAETIADRGTEQEAYQDFMPTLWDTINKSKASYPEKDIFVEIYLEMRPSLKTRIKHFRSRTTCPKPQFCQMVFQYKYISGDLILLWSLPQEWQCKEIKDNALVIDPAFRDLRDFVIDFYDGTLLTKVKEINKDAILKQNIILTLDTDKKLEQKENHTKKVKEINERRKRIKLY
jgi:hypothetical protein